MKLTGNITLMEFLKMPSSANGDEAIEIISAYQSNSFSVAGIYASEFDNS